MKAPKLLKLLNDRYLMNMNPANISVHFAKHLQPLIDIRTKVLVEEAAIEQRDSIEELNKLMTKCDDTIELVDLDPNDKLFIKAINAKRQLFNAKTQMIKAYAKLTGEDESKGRAPSITKTLEAFKTIVKQKEEEDRKKTILIEEKGKK